MAQERHMVALYANSSNKPGALVAGTSVTIGNPTKGAWNCKSLASGVVISATSYFVAILSTAGNESQKFNSSSGNSCWDSGSTTYTSFPSTFPASNCGSGEGMVKGTN
jgi:hypothetical protein